MPGGYPAEHAPERTARAGAPTPLLSTYEYRLRLPRPFAVAHWIQGQVTSQVPTLHTNCTNYMTNYKYKIAPFSACPVMDMGMMDTKHEFPCGCAWGLGGCGLYPPSSPPPIIPPPSHRLASNYYSLFIIMFFSRTYLFLHVSFCALRSVKRVGAESRILYLSTRVLKIWLGDIYKSEVASWRISSAVKPGFVSNKAGMYSSTH